MVYLFKLLTSKGQTAVRTYISFPNGSLSMNDAFVEMKKARGKRKGGEERVEFVAKRGGWGVEWGINPFYFG